MALNLSRIFGEKDLSLASDLKLGSTNSDGISAFFLPRDLRAGENPKEFWFLHTPTGDSWPVNDPVAWALTHSQQPIVERARQRLVTLDASDAQRVIRLVTRRCGLNLIEIQPERVVVHH